MKPPKCQCLGKTEFRTLGKDPVWWYVHCPKCMRTGNESRSQKFSATYWKIGLTRTQS